MILSTTSSMNITKHLIKKLSRSIPLLKKTFSSHSNDQLINVSNHNSIKLSDISAIVLNANGPVFSSGHNLKEFLSEEGIELHKDILHNCSQVMNKICDLPIPVIAAVRGLATAAGCQLVASCDLAVAGESTLFATPGVKIGLFCTTPGVAVGRAVPTKIAMQMLLTGEPITAQQALNYGLVNRVVPDDSVENESIKLAESIAQYSRSVIALGKPAFQKQMSMPRHEAYDYAEKVMVQNLRMTDCQEGISSFLKKRKPEWTHSNDTIY